MFRELVFLSLLVTVIAQWDMMVERESKRSQQYCGEELNNALFFICGGRFNSPFDKKSVDYPNYPDYNALDGLEYTFPENKFPFHQKARALSAFEYRRLKKGVSDECCRKSCTLHEIKSYCLRRS